MKKNVFIGILFFSLCTLAFAQSDLQVIANVNYSKNEPITLGKLKQFVKSFELRQRRKFTVDERMAALETLIGQTFLLQVAEKNRIKVLDSQVDNYFNGIMSQQVGAPVTEAQLAKIVKQQHGKSLDQFLKENIGYSVKEFKQFLRDSLMIQQFIGLHKKDELQRMATPSDAEIRKYYELNKQEFFRSELLEVLFVGVEKKGNAAAETKKINELYAQAKKGKKAISKIQSGAANGAYVVRKVYAPKAPESAPILGLKNVEDLMKLFNEPINYVSKLIDRADSKQFYIITKKYEAKLLALSDVVDPNTNITVYEGIKGSLTQKMAMMASEQIMGSLIKELSNDKNYKKLFSDEKLKKLLNW